MAQQANTKPNEMSAIEGTPQLSASTKGAFFAWLDVGHTKKYSPTVCLLCMDKVSDYLIRRKIVVFDLWQFTNYELFEIIYSKASNDKLLKATDKKMHALFVQIGQLYLKFLKTKPALHKVPISADGAPSPSDSRLTIKKAIIQVLADETHGLTPEQIYNKIIENHLYTFGAKNPKAIVCVEINRACENSNCTIRASKNYFRFEINPEGKKVYFLLETNKISAREHCSSDGSETVGQINRTSHNYFTVDERAMSAVLLILEEHFPNGIRPNSVIDMNRLKGYCHEVDGAEILSESIDI